MKRSDLLQAGGYISLSNAILANPALSAADKIVLAVMINALGPQNEQTWIGPARIAAATGLSIDTVSRSRRDLRKAGWLHQVGATPNGCPIFTIQPPQSAPRNLPSAEYPPQFAGGAYPQDAGATPPQVAVQSTEVVSTEEKILNDGAAPPAAVAALPPADAGMGTVSADAVIREASPARNTSVGSSSRRREKTAPAQDKLSDEEISLACSSSDMMTRYLLFGREGLRDPQATNLPPSSSNWRRFGGSREDPKTDLWQVSHFMGWWWFRVSYWRANHNVALALPSWGRMAGNFRNLVASMGKGAVFHYANFVTDNFDLIRHQLGRVGQTLVLDENTLTNSMVRGAADSLMALGPFQLQEKLNEMQRARTSPILGIRN